MGFFVVNQAGTVEASVTARVRCGGTTSGKDLTVQAGSFFPLQVGNTWIYRMNSRNVTSAYVTRSITGTEELGGQTYYVLTSDGAVIMHLRGDPDGRIWRFTGTNAAPKEDLLLDPSVVAHAPFNSPLGAFPDAALQTLGDPLGREDQIYVRGLGLAQTESRLLSGSSGGFSSGLYLAEARLDGIRVAIPTPKLSLSLENSELDVTGKKVTNCAVPYYCAACGFGGADGPGVYKPCAQVRLEGNASSAYTLELELLNEAGEVVFRAPEASGGPGDWLRYVQVQLYSQPNRPIPLGAYSVVTRLKNNGVTLATSTRALQIF